MLDVRPDDQLSPHFSLQEMLASHTASRLKINNQPTDLSVIANLKALCTVVLEPIRQMVDKPVIITSGYRSRALNTRLGGAVQSQHMFGEAADFTVNGVDMAALAKALETDNTLPFDQLIFEEVTRPETNSTRRWIHISHRRVSFNRSEARTIRRCGLQKLISEGIKL